MPWSNNTGQGRVTKMQNALKNAKVALLCIVLIVLVIYSTRLLDNGPNVTTTQSNLHRAKQLNLPNMPNCNSVNKRIAEEQDSESSDSNKDVEEVVEINPNSYESVNMTKLMADDDNDNDNNTDDGEEKGVVTNKPYTLGPKISDWDERRAEWLKNNPQFPNFVQPNKPRVLLVTGSSPKPCENRVGDHYLLKSIKNKIDYCRIHGIEIFYNMALLDAEMAGFWAKLPWLRKLLLAHPEVEFLWWLDSDAMFTDMAFELPWERYKDVNLVMHGWNDSAVYDDKNWVGVNTGSLLLRNTQWSLDLLDALAPMGPKGKIREEAGKILTKELMGRPAFEADDQSAMVYLLATQKDKWAQRVYLEKAYELHGFWEIIVEKYEEMIENYHPGLGDKRWPLITHFTGCKPCAKLSNYRVERCLAQMDRAFNFGDNQVMELYGFTHKSLSSRKVVRTRKESSKPLQVKDELGLLHPSYRAVNVLKS